MHAGEIWNLFLETGAPEYYLAFQAMKRQEESHVSENPGTGAAAGGLRRT